MEYIRQIIVALLDWIIDACKPRKPEIKKPDPLEWDEIYTERKKVAEALKDKK